MSLLQISFTHCVVLLTLAQHQIFSLVFERACSFIQVIRASLATLQKAPKGLVVMSSDIETLAKNMFALNMPILWAPVSYTTMNPLNNYFNHVLDRLNMLQSWMDNGPSMKFWLSGFFTHGFLTGVLQNLHASTEFQ